MLYYIFGNSTLTPESAVIMFLITIFAFIMSLSLHEFAHALAAHKMGDATPKLAGRLTLNPIKHVSLIGFISFMLVGIGWAKPTPVNPLNFKKYRSGTRWVSISGILANFVLGLVCAGLSAILYATVGIPTEAMQYLYLLLDAFMIVNSFLALFNLLPIYPFDGFTFISSFMKGNSKFVQNSIKHGTKILLIVLISTILIDLLFNFDILDWYLSIVYNYIYLPIVGLGV